MVFFNFKFIYFPAVSRVKVEESAAQVQQHATHQQMKQQIHAHHKRQQHSSSHQT